MNFVAKAAIIGGATLALAGIAAPASAAPWYGGAIIVGDYGTTNLDGASWYVNDQGSIDHSRRALNGETYSQVVCGTYGGLIVDGNYLAVVGDLDLSVAENGDQVVVGEGTFGNLDATVEYRVYAEGDLLRTVYVLTNNTGSDITFTPSTYEDPEDNFGEGSTSSGDVALGNGDNWYQVYSTAEHSGVYTKFTGDLSIVGGDILNPVAGEYGEVVYENITIAAGASYQVILFHSYATYDLSGDEAAVSAAAAAAGQVVVDEFDGGLVLSERLATGLNSDIASNFTFVADEAPVEEEEVLAETGVNAMAGIALGVAVAAAGAVLVLRRRTV